MSAQGVLGIDEAGRGPAIGPMVVACVLLLDEQLDDLKDLGLRDSKEFGSGAGALRERARVAKEIVACAHHVGIRVVDVARVDRRVKKKELNHLERDSADELIRSAPPVARIIADGKTLFSPLTQIFPHLEAYNKGESVHLAVAAASIVAKTRRDLIYEKIRRRYLASFGEIRGGGYVNPPTRKFLSDHVKRFGGLPPEARQSWPHEYAFTTQSNSAKTSHVV